MQSQPEITEPEGEFVVLLTKHQASLRAYIISLMPGLPGADDVLQETNIRLWNKRKDFELGTNFTAWSFAIARFVVLEHRRRLRRDGVLLFDDELLDSLTSDPNEYRPELVNSRHEALEKCLAKLKPDDRKLLDRRYADAGSIEKYAREIGKTSAALRMSLGRIRTALRKCIHREITGEGGLA